MKVHVPHSFDDVSWMERGACLGSHVEMFPSKGKSLDPAREACRTCPVRRECLDYAVRNNIRHGVWGGLDDKARRPLRRRLVAS